MTTPIDLFSRLTQDLLTSYQRQFGFTGLSELKAVIMNKMENMPTDSSLSEADIRCRLEELFQSIETDHEISGDIQLEDESRILAVAQEQVHHLNQEIMSLRKTLSDTMDRIDQMEDQWNG